MALFRKAKAASGADDAAQLAVSNAAAIEARIQERIRVLIAKRQSEYRQHLSSTRQLLADVAAVLVSKIETNVL
jgi:hypothetical protein